MLVGSGAGVDYANAVERAVGDPRAIHEILGLSKVRVVELDPVFVAVRERGACSGKHRWRRYQRTLMSEIRGTAERNASIHERIVDRRSPAADESDKPSDGTLNARV